MLDERHDKWEAKLEALRKAVREGLEELDQREGVPGGQVFEEILARLDPGRTGRT